jgi:uncharacterized protein (DUF1810 family)
LIVDDISRLFQMPLNRFVDAQTGVMDRVRRELRTGKKRTHWMWFIFPQIEGLGRSETSRFYALHSLQEAKEFLDDPVLGPRLEECVRLVLETTGTLAEIFGSPDDLKFASSMTLFHLAKPEHPLFREALDRFCEGKLDRRTITLSGAGVE